MAESAPNWITIFLGGSGFLGAVALVTKGIVKGIVEKKDDHIRYLTKINQDLERDVEEERQKTQKAIDAFRDLFTKINTSQESTDNAVIFREISNLVTNLEKTLSEGYNDCKQASRWLEICKADWVKKASKHAKRKYPGLIPWNKTTSFKKDLTQYLTWVSTCLDRYSHTYNSPISNFVKVPVVSSPHPYVAAVNYIIDQGKWGELNSAQIAYLREVLIRLKERIQALFDN